jgi:chromosomal replication initiation ATPase DnaA
MELKELWEKILLDIEPNIKRLNFVTWFQDTAVIHYENGVLQIGIPNPFAKDWLSKKYHGFIETAAKKFLPDLQKIEYSIAAHLQYGQDPRSVDVKSLAAQPLKTLRKLPNKAEFRVTRDGVQSKFLNDRYKLDNFVVGGENRLAACGEF